MIHTQMNTTNSKLERLCEVLHNPKKNLIKTNLTSESMLETMWQTIFIIIIF